MYFVDTEVSIEVGTFSLSAFAADKTAWESKNGSEQAGVVGVTGISLSSDEESVDTDIELMGVLRAESGLRETGVVGNRQGKTCRTYRFPVKYHCTV